MHEISVGRDGSVTDASETATWHNRAPPLAGRRFKPTHVPLKDAPTRGRRSRWCEERAFAVIPRGSEVDQNQPPSADSSAAGRQTIFSRTSADGTIALGETTAWQNEPIEHRSIMNSL